MGPAVDDVRARLHAIEDRLDPKIARESARDELNELFGNGRAPDPSPDGLLRGRALASTITPALDAMGRRLSAVYMPWLGKKFDAAAGRGVNVLTPSAIKPMKVLWPSYEPLSVFADRIEAFGFTTRLERGAVDPDLSVLKIDYDFAENPGLIIRRVLDELVQLDDGLYLGKVLYRLRGSFRLIGFFSLEQ
jgi:hypothetical protein